MKRQLNLFDRTYLMLCKSVDQAEAAYEKACKHHRGRKASWIILNACRTAQLKYEAKHLKSATTQHRKAA